MQIQSSIVYPEPQAVHTSPSSSNAKVAYMSLQIMSTQLTGPPAAAAATAAAMDTASTVECEKKKTEPTATKEDEVAAEPTCLA